MRGIETGSGRARPAPRRRRETPTAPGPVGVFAQPELGRADAPITQARQTADRHRRRAEAALPGTTVPGVQRIPDIPLNHRQRQAVLQTARQVAVRARAQGINVTDAAANGDPVTREFFGKAAQAFADEQKHVHVKAGLAQIRANPDAFGIKPHQLDALHKLAVRNAIPEDVRTQLAGVGERAAAASRSTAKEGHLAQGIPGAAHRLNMGLDQRLFTQAPNLRLATTPLQIARVQVIDPAAKALSGDVGGGLSDAASVAGKTIKGVTEMAVGAPAALVETVIRPGKTFGALIDDYTRRYGPLLQGDSQTFRARLRKDGYAAEAIDTASVLAIEGGLLGRGAGVAARGGALGARLERLATEPRPNLRVSGNLARPQELSDNLFRAAGQRGQDRARRVMADRRQGAAMRRAEGEPALQPQAGEVVPLTRRSQARAQRIAVSQIKGRGYISNRHEQNIELNRGVERDLRNLPRKTRRAVFHAMQGLVPLGDPVAARAMLARRGRQIVGEREARVVAKGLEGDGFSKTEAHAAGEIIRRARLEGGGATTVEGLLADVRAAITSRDARAAGASQHLEQWIARHHESLRTALKEPRTLAHTREMETLRFLHEHADAIFAGDHLHGFHAANLQRSLRTEKGDPAFGSMVAEVRRFRPQGELLGIQHPVEAELRRIEHGQHDGQLTAEEAAAARAELEQRRPDLMRDYVDEVRAAAAHAGLPEPAYVLHQPRPFYSKADRTVGIARAVQGTRESRMSLFRTGTANTDPRVFVQGIAKNIKRKHQWSAVADVADQHVFPWSRGKSVEEIRREIDRRGLSHEDVAYLDLGLLRRIQEGAGPDGETFAENPTLHHALRMAVKPGEELKIRGGENVAGLEQQLAGMDSHAKATFLRTKGFVAVPREVAKEILEGTRPSGAGARVFGKAQGMQSAAILGLNPSWLQMQVAANALLTTIGTRGALGELLKGHALYKDMSPAERELVDRIANVGVFEAHSTPVHLGAAVHGRVIDQARLMGETKIAEALRHANPTRLMFHADDMQNKVFRRAVLSNALKREAFRRIRREAGAMAATQARLEGLLKLKPTETVRDQITRILEHPHDVERLGEHVNNLLGDYVRYTARERRYFKPYIMFYGFLRYALRTAFYTLPVKHPIAGAIAGKLSQLHRQEVQDLLGGDSAPWAYSRIYFGKRGDLRSIDLGRINPVTSPVTDVVTKGPKALGGLMSPMIQAAIDQVYSTSLFHGRGFRTNGSASTNPNPALGDRFRIALNQTLSSAFPYREAVKLTQGAGAQGDDSLLFSPRPVVYKGAAAQARNQERISEAGSKSQQLLRDIFPLAFTKPDERTRELVAGQNPAGGASGPAGGLDAVDTHDLRQAVQDAQGGLDGSDLEEIKQLVRDGAGG